MKIEKMVENTYFSLVSFEGKTVDEEGIINFNYICSGNSFECGVTFIYTPLDDNDEAGKEFCDVDIHAGGDGVGAPDVITCIANAWALHVEYDVAKGYIMTDG